ncbi:MAG: hypothetical protein ACQKBV_00670 [Puniceicoccales bacterium]
MLVPQYWAEARLRERSKERGQVTLRRFGWSDESPEAAQAMADERVAAAMERWRTGELPHQSEPKVAYNGADGVPIREEIIERHGESVITRNGYGALCLNTPNVLFADIDFRNEPHPALKFGCWYLLFATGCIWAYLSGSWLPFFIGLVVSLILFNEIAAQFNALIDQHTGGAVNRALKDVRAHVQEHPFWSLRIYRTPNGLRVLAMHDLFDPRSDETAALFKSLRADKLYVSMCRNQNCFRARLSPKPWRIGMEQRLRPQPGVWPVAPERIPARREWVAEYENMAVSFAACRYQETIGEGAHHPAAEAIRDLHDRLCQADSKLPLA